MSDFGSSGRFQFEGGGSKEFLIGKVQDMKAAPRNGEQRVIVKEKNGAARTVAVDMPAECAKDLERKETYRFEVQEKDNSRYGHSRRKSSSGFTAYQSETAPEKGSGSGTWNKMFDRFSNNEKGTGGRARQKFPK